MSQSPREHAGDYLEEHAGDESGAHAGDGDGKTRVEQKIYKSSRAGQVSACNVSTASVFSGTS